MSTTPELLLLIAAVFGGIVSVIRAWRDRRIEDAIGGVKETAKVIEGHVNSAASIAHERAEAGAARELALQSIIDDLKTTARALALAQAAAAAAGKQTPS
jgi:hypothetical protein